LHEFELNIVKTKINENVVFENVHNFSYRTILN
jgi:hypothetical protein